MEAKTKLGKFLESQTYKKDFRDLMLGLEKKYGTGLITENGIGSQLDISNASKKFFKAMTTADVSVDANANVTDKSVISHKIEIAKPFHLINSYYRLWKEIKKNKSKEYADFIVESQITGRIYINDFVGFSSSMPYCFNYSTYDTAVMGIPSVFDGRGGSKAPKSLMAFLGQIELFSLIAGNSTLGATGLADLLLVMSIYIDKILQTQSDAHAKYVSEEDCWQYVESMLTGFIYRLNQPYRGSQSLFSNVSVYDNNFIDSMIKDDAYTLLINDVVYKAKKENIQKLQEIYLNIMNNEMARKPITFPVTTACFSIDENGELLDQEFVDFIAEQNLKFGFINIYSGKSSTLSSCCFDGSQEVQIKVDGEILNLPIKDAVKKENIKLLYNNEWLSAKPVVLTEKRTMYHIVTEGNRELRITDNHINVTKRGNIETKNLTIDDELLLKDGKYDKIQTIDTYDYEDENVYCFEMKNQDKPYFTLPNGIITHNCRLRSERDNEYFNSFGSGSTKIGSLGVATGNLPQLAYKVKDHEDPRDEFLHRLKELVVDCQEINRAKRSIINRTIKANAQPLYSLGYVELARQYSTFGVVGLYEALETLGLDITTKEGQDYVLQILDVINTTNSELQKRFKAPHNCEQIPAENVAVKLAKKDRVLGFNENYTLYSNQFIPLIKKVNMFDRIKIQGLFDKYFSGGAICHINLDQEITDKEVMKGLIRSCAKKGVVYFAINYVLKQCEDGHMTVGNITECPICGKKIIATYTRVVGFLTKVDGWIPERREYDFPNRQFYGEIEQDD